MSSDKVIIFDIKGEYGHFRKFNTTTSPLTYSIPTLSAIHGMLGAILGIEREDSHGNVKEGQPYLNELFCDENCKIAIQPLSEIKRTNFPFNLLIVKSNSDFYNIKGRTQIEFEVLKNPYFRIFLNWHDGRKGELIERLRLKKYYFNPYLGLAQMTADIIYQGEEEIQSIGEDRNYIDFKTAINLSEIKSQGTPIEIEEMSEKTFQVETFPLEMGIDRTIKRYGEILVETNGDIVKAFPNDKSYQLNSGMNIQFL